MKKPKVNKIQNIEKTISPEVILQNSQLNKLKGGSIVEEDILGI